jgi:hypothetical protein
MERIAVLELMAELKLDGMRAAYDEVMATGIKRRHEPPCVIGDLLSAEITEQKARSIKYQLTIAKLPLPKDLDESDFAGTPINEVLVQELAAGGFLAGQRDAVLIGGTGNAISPLRSPALHPQLRARPLLHCRRPRQPAGKRGPHQPSGAACRLPRSARLRHPRRTGLSALRPDRRTVASSS